MTRAEIEAILAGTKGVTPGPWYASDWSFDGGAHTTTIETRQPEVLNPGQSSIWSMVATTAETDGEGSAGEERFDHADHVFRYGRGCGGVLALPSSP